MRKVKKIIEGGVIINILFLGGSNTWGAGADRYEDSFAGKTSAYLADKYGAANIFNMGISGTASRLCAFMIRDFIQKAAPDLVFFEYSINDSKLALSHEDYVLTDTEFVVRTLREHNPRVRIVMLLLAKSDFTACGETHMKIARHYGLNYLDLQLKMKELTQNGMLWDNFFVDAVHPGNQGHAYCFEQIKAFFEKQKSADLARTPTPLPSFYTAPFYKAPRVLPMQNLSKNEWETAMYDDVKRDEAVLVSRYLRCAQPGKAIAFSFSGHTFGLYHLVRHDCGKLCITLDGTPHTLDCYYACDGDFVSFFNQYELADGLHEVTIELLPDRNEKSDGYEAGICGFLVD